MDLSGRKYDIFIPSQHLPGLPGGLQRLVLELTNLQGSILAAKRPLAFLDPLGGHLWLNHVEHCWTPHDFLVLFQTERRIELHQAGKKSDSGTIFRLDNWWNGVWIRFLQKKHLAYKKLPGGYIFFLGGCRDGLNLPPTKCVRGSTLAEALGMASRMAPMVLTSQWLGQMGTSSRAKVNLFTLW